jgi:hypothetical protein
VGDEFVTGAAQLVGVAIARELEGSGYRLSIDREGWLGLVTVAVFAPSAGLDVELLDHGENVSQ